mgnify:CR=1 FL=1
MKIGSESWWSPINPDTSKLEMTRLILFGMSEMSHSGTMANKPTSRMLCGNRKESSSDSQILRKERALAYVRRANLANNSATKEPWWIEAMNVEIQALCKNDTWDLVRRSPHRKVIGYIWIYKINYNVESSVNLYKARLVAKGYAQTCGVYYEETFAQWQSWQLLDIEVIRTPVEIMISQQHYILNLLYKFGIWSKYFFLYNLVLPSTTICLRNTLHANVLAWWTIIPPHP